MKLRLERYSFSPEQTKGRLIDAETGELLGEVLELPTKKGWKLYGGSYSIPPQKYKITQWDVGESAAAKLGIPLSVNAKGKLGYWSFGLRPYPSLDAYGLTFHGGTIPKKHSLGCPLGSNSLLKKLATYPPEGELTVNNIPDMQASPDVNWAAAISIQGPDTARIARGSLTKDKKPAPGKNKPKESAEYTKFKKRMIVVAVGLIIFTGIVSGIMYAITMRSKKQYEAEYEQLNLSIGGVPATAENLAIAKKRVNDSIDTFIRLRWEAVQRLKDDVNNSNQRALEVWRPSFTVETGVINEKFKCSGFGKPPGRSVWTWQEKMTHDPESMVDELFKNVIGPAFDRYNAINESVPDIKFVVKIKNQQ